MYAYSIPISGRGGCVLRSDGADYLDGGEGDDGIFGFGGDDHIFGGPGNDSLSGETPDMGEPWNPIPYFPAGHDFIFAGPGHDWLYGGAGNDQLYGDSGNDTILGGLGDDAAWGGAGHDNIGGGDGDDWLHGEEGDDTIEGNNGQNTITGGQGDDQLTGGPNRDILDGNEGNDTLSGSGDHYELDTSSSGFGGRYLLIESNLRRIADLNMDGRHFTITLTDEYGLSMTYMRNLLDAASYTGDTDSTVMFPLFEADTEYTVTRTVSAGLTGNHTETFTPSDPQISAQFRAGVLFYNFGDVLSTNTVCNKDPEDESLSPECEVPDPPPPSAYPRNDEGPATISGGTVTINPLANDVFTGNATIQIISGPSLGTATLSGNTITYTAHADKWGLDLFKYKITVEGQQVPVIAAVYVAVNTIEVQAPKSAWVGEPVRPIATTKGLANVPIPENAQYVWTVSEKAIGYWQGVKELSQLTPVDGELTKKPPRFYWVDGGAKEIGLTLTVPGQPASTASATITINRKPVSVSTITSNVDIHTRDNGETWIQFGKTGVVNEIPGVEFRRGFILGMPAGTFLWVQVVDQTETQDHRTTGMTRRCFGGGMIDKGYPYDPNLDQNGTDDSPGSRLSPSPIPGADVDNVEFQATFSMYLLWQPALPGSIPVPLTVVHWSVSQTAAWDGTKWVKLLGTFNVPPAGEDTTTYPAWVGALEDESDLTCVDGD